MKYSVKNTRGCRRTVRAIAFVSVLLLLILAVWSVSSLYDERGQSSAAVNDTFQSNTVEGVTVTYEVLTESAGNYTVQIGAYSNAVSNYTVGTITIPSTVSYNGNVYTVKTVGAYAFTDCSGVSSIILPNSVTSIGNYAFQKCYSLSSFTIPNSVTFIGLNAFDGCSSISSINIPNVTSISNYTFNGCTALISVTIPTSVTSIGDSAFSYCSALTSVTIPTSVTSIGDSAFSYCSALTSVNIPTGVTSIEAKVFIGCAALTSITIPANVTSIGDYAFYGCAALTSITIPANVTSIGNYAFYGCAALTSITIPANVTSIGGGAFQSCTALHFMVIERTTSFTSLGTYCFDTRCLLGLSIRTTLSSSTFSDTTSSYTVLATGSTLLGGISGSGTIGALSWNFSNGVLTISGSGALTGSQSMHWEGSGMYFDGLITSVVFASGSNVTSIGDYAFRGCTALTSITIPDSVTSIGNYAFRGCTALPSIILNNVTSIGGNAFKDCYALTSVTIPSGVTSIGSYVFQNCYALTSVTIPSGVTNIGSDAFQNCYALTSVTIPSGVTNIAGLAFQNCYALTSVTIPSGVTIIAIRTFQNCYALTSVTIPSGVTNIGSDAFQNCYALTSVTIPSGVTSIGSDAFQNCYVLTSVTIPSGVTSIFDYTFQNCYALTSVIIPSGVTSIGDYSFQNCYALTSVTIPDTLTNIGTNTFNACNSMRTMHVTFSDTATGITTGGIIDLYFDKSSTNWVLPGQSSITLTRLALENISSNTYNPNGTSGIYGSLGLQLSYQYSGNVKECVYSVSESMWLVPCILTLTGDSEITAFTYVVNGGSSNAYVSAFTVSSGDVLVITAYSVTGYSFSSWSGYISSMDNPLTVTISSDVALSAASTANTYVVTLEGGLGTDGSATATYDGVLSSIVNSSRIGYTLEGYYTTSGLTVKVINDDGSLVPSISPYTDSNGKWIYADNITFYAKWAINLYTVSGTLTVTGGASNVGVTITLDTTGIDYTAVTTTGGDYTISDIPYGTSGNITASMTGYHQTNTVAVASMTDNVSGKDPALAINQYTVTGTLTVTGGASNAGVTITFYPIGVSYYFTSVTRADGVYVMIVPYGTSGNITVSMTGYHQTNAVSVASVTDNVSGKDPALAIDLYTVSGTLTVTGGASAGGVTVSLGAYSTTTVAGGTYTITDVPYGTSGNITASITGYHQTNTVAVASMTDNVSGKDPTLTINLYTVSGTLTVTGGASNVGVTITLDTTGIDYTAVTTTGGDYTISDIPYGTSGTIKASITGYHQTNTVAVASVTDNVSGKDPALAINLYTVSGTLTVTGGASAGGVTVSLGAYSTTTVAGGTYTITDVPYGTSGNITASITGYHQTNTVAVASMTDNVSGKDPTLTINLYTVSGTLTVTGGASNVGVTITLDTTGIDYTAVTTTGGDYTISDIPYGTSGTIKASITGYHQTNTVAVASVTDNVSGKDPALAINLYTVSGTLTVTGGASAGGVTVSLGAYSTTTVAGGTYTITDVPYGTSGNVTASMTGYHQTNTVAVASMTDNVSGKDPTLTINLYTVSGTLTVTGGASSEGVTITLDTAGTDYTATTGTGGAYTILNVPYGTTGDIKASITGYHQTVTPSVTAINANMTGKGLTLTINQYTVSFNGNGSTSGSMPQMNMTYGTEYVLTSNAFFKSGSAFIGWSLSDSATIPTYSNRDSVVNLTAVSGGNVILYAVWEDSKYTVEFNGNGGTGYMPDQYLSSGAAVRIDVCIYSFAGKAFLGWDTDSSADTVVYTDMQTVKDLVSAGYTEMLYAVWSATGSSYTVTFDGNGGTGYMSDQNFASGEAGILIQNVFAKSGSTFQGWSTALNGPVVYTDGQTVRDIASAGGTVTLYAVWTPNASSYTVTFLGNGGTGYMPIQNFTVGTAKALEQNIYAKTGYTFQGWSLVLNGSVIYTEGQTVRDLASAGGTVTLYAVWSADSYTVTFNGNGGTGYMPAQNFTSISAKTLQQNVFTRSGYTFQGWSAASDGPVMYTDGQKIVVSSSMTLYAVWTADASSYTVTFNGNGGTGYMPIQNFTAGVAKSLEQNIFSMTGYTFQGWATSSAGTEEYNDGQKIVVTANMTLFAVWSDATSYTVTYDGNGGTGVMSNQNFTSVPKALMQNIFVNSGSTFQGWSTTSDGPVMYTDGQKIIVTSSTTLYAVWTADSSSYTVIFDSNTGTGVMFDQYFTSGVAKSLEQNKFVNTGNTFQGWSTVLNGDVVYTDGQTVKDLASATGTVTLYAVWSATGSSYTVTFDSNNGTGYMPVQNFTSGTAKSLEQNVFSKSGSTFQGWSAVLNGAVVYTDGQTVKDLVSAGGTVTLYAVWSATGSSYTVTFNGNGGTGYMPIQNFTSGAAKAIQQNSFSKSGSTFQGWATALNGNVVYTDGQTVKDLVSATGTVTLYAVWSATGSSYTVTFNGNGGTGYMPDQNFTSGTAKPLEQNIFFNSGSTFQGWATALNGAVVYTDGQKIVVTANMTLYAAWSSDATSYTVTFLGNGGTGYMPIQNFTSGTAKALQQNIFAKSGNTFQGWSLVLNGSVIYTEGQTVKDIASATGTVTLYAVWSATGSSYTVTFNGNGGTGYMPAQNFASGIAKALEQNLFAKTGNTFQGWSTVLNGPVVYTDGQKIVVSSSMTLYAVWTADSSSYTVIFSGNGGTGYMPAQNFTSGTAKSLEQNIFSMTGYTFQGWATSSAGTEEYNDGQKIVVTANMTLFAVWSDATSYTVTYDGNGGTGVMSNQNFTSVPKALMQNIFVNSGSTFQGWSTTSDGPVMYTDGQKIIVTSSTTLYAVWTADSSSYTVIFDSNTGTGVMFDQYFTSGVAKSLEQNKFVNTGNTFQGWSLTSGGSVLYTNGQMVKDIASSTGTVTLYAVWSATGSSYTVTFDSNNGTGYMPVQNFTSGTAKSLEQNVFSKSGSTFQGWSAVLNGAVVYTDGQTVKDLVSAGGTVTLYAVWSATGSSYTVTFNGNGGTGYMPAQNFTSGAAKAIQQNSFSKSGSTFQGWATALNGNVVYTDGQTVKDLVSATGTVTLYAVWSATGSSYTVTFNGNGGTGYMPDQNFTSGTAKPLEQNIFFNSGSTFQGWSLTSGGPVLYTDGQMVKDIASATGTVTLYAVWNASASSYTVTFLGNGGTGYMPIQNFTSGTAKPLEQNIFAKSGNTFQGWSLVLNGSVIYTEGQTVKDIASATGTVTLYAVWSATGSSYTVTFNGNGGTGYMPAQNFASGIAKALEQNLFAKTGNTFQGWSTVLNGPVVYTDGQKIVVSSSTTLYAVWTSDASSYTVIFSGNGGTGYMPAQNFTAGVAKSLEQNIFSMTGYTFQGWATSSAGTEEYNDGQKIVVTANMTLFAVWSDATTYVVTFNGNGGTGVMSNQNFTSVPKALMQNIFVNSGSTFQGWSTTSDGPVMYTDGQKIIVTSSTTLYAVWTADSSSYTVIFDSNTGTGVMFDQYFTSGVAKSLEQNKFVNTGNTFQGWSLTSGGSVLYTNGQMVKDIASSTGTVTLYAVWAPNGSSYTVTFDSNNGTGYMPVQNFASSVSKSLEQNIFSKSGNTFQGWSLTSGGSVLYTDSQIVKDIASAGGNVTLYAVWTATGSSYTVTFNGNGGTGYMPAQNFTSGVAKALEQNIFVNNGNTFQGWALASGGPALYTNGQMVKDIASATGTVTLYAVWSSNASSYTVTFDSNSGTGYMPDQNFTAGTAKALEQNIFAKSGNTFQGWSLVLNGSVIYTEGQTVKDIASATGTVTLYAVWSATGSSYTVTFNGNGGTGYMPAQNFTSGTAKALEQNVFTRSGYAFQGWALASGGSVLYTDSQIVKDIASAGGNVTLYAVWTATGSSYTVTFNGNGGTGYMPAQNFTSGVAKALEQNIFAKTGNTFQGWSTVLNGPVVYTDGQKIVVSSSTTLYAVWTSDASSYTVIFSGNGGTGYMPAQNFTVDIAKSLEQNIFSMTGYTFQGWALASGGPVFYTDGQTVKDIASATGTITLYAVWSVAASSYNVIFDSNGGTGYMSAQNFATGTVKALQQNVFVNTGNTFQGWSAIVDGDVVYLDGQMVLNIVSAGNTVVLYAVWSADASSYTVVFDSNGGTGYMPDENFTSGVAKALQQNIFVNTGNTFQGWATVSGGAVIYTDVQVVLGLASAGGTVTLYAVWTSDSLSYTVTFDAEDGTGYMPAQNFTSGVSKALEQNKFTRAGRTFAGWSLVSGGVASYADGQSVIDIAAAGSSMVLYAVWTDAITYEVVFDGNGSTSGFMSIQNFTAETVTAIHQNGFFNTGSTFQGWATALNGDVVYVDGQRIVVSSSMTLYAVWTLDASSFTVIFNGNGGTGVMFDQHFTSGVAKSLEQNIFVNTGNTFQGWSLAPGGPVLYTDGQKIVISADKTLYAVWSPDASSYTVVFNSNGGTGLMFDQYFTSGIAKALEQNAFVRAGYAFQGWSLAPGGAVAYTDGQTAFITVSTTLYAAWTADTSSYTVIFDSNTGTGYMPAQNFTENTAKALQQNIFVKSGYTFQGWSTASDGTVEYTDGQKIVVASSMTLYAVWSSDASSYTVTFDGNGGTGYMPAQNFTSGVAKALEQNIFVNTGSTFQGWSLTSGGSVLYTNGQMVKDIASATGTVTLYAIWSPDASSYTVTFDGNGGTGYMPDQDFTSDVSKALAQNMFANNGNTFQGWALASGGSVLYTDGQKISVTADMTLYAVWSSDASSYTVTFDGNGGAGYMPAQNFTSGVAKALEQNIFVNNGNTFQGWSLTSGGSVLYTNGQMVKDIASATGTVTLYAVWSPDASSYTVTFDGNGGTGYMPAQNFTSGTAKALEQNVFTRSGYAFQGWSLASGGPVLYTDGQKISVTADTTLFAVWTLNASSYTVTFDGNGGTGYMPAQNFTSGVSKSLAQNLFANTGSTFQGWSSVVDGEVVYSDGQKIVVASDMTLYAVWTFDASSFTVTFNGNGGTGLMPDQYFTADTAKALAQNLFANTGSTFQGWALAPGGPVFYTDGQKIFVTADMALYAIWSPDASSYTVVFNSNGGTGYMPDQHFTSGTAKALEQNVFTRSGYTFQGWAVLAAGDVVFTDGQSVKDMAAAGYSVTLYAVWTSAASYAVTFDSNTGTGYMPAQNFTENTAKALQQNIFVKSGYTFQGWSTASDGTVEYTDGQKIVVASSMTLYAVWSSDASSYTVTFDGNGGTGYMPAQNFTSGVAKALEQNIFVNTGSTFQGWSLTSGGSVLYTNGQMVKDIASATGTVTLYAIWSPDASSYTVTFDGNGGTGYMPDQDFTSDVSKALAQNMFANNGNTFQGWALASGGSVLYTDGQKISVTADMTLYAVWSSDASSYTVTFDGNGGAGYMPAQNFTSGVAKALEQNIFVNNGNTFQGWSLTSGGSVLYTNGQMVKDIASATGTVTLYAVWSPDASSYTVTFDGNGGTGYMPAQNFTSGTAKALEQNVFTRSGYAFQGWSLASGGPVLYTDGQKISVTADTTLFAVWTLNASSYTVTFDGNGGTGYMPAQNFTSGVSKSLAQNLFANTGSTFQGWSSVVDGEVVYSDGQKIVVASDMTLYAVWTFDASSFTVTFNGNGGTGLMPDQYFTADTAKALAQNLFANTGSTFQGWALAPGGPVFYTDGQKIFVTADMALYAIWSPDASSYTVVFNSNGGTGYMPDQDFTSGVAKALQQNVFTRSGYTFQGWAVLAAGDVVFTDGQSVKDMAAAGYSVTLYAVWTSAASYAVTFDSNTGTGYMPAQNFTENTAKALQQNIFVKSGYTFQGWSTASDGTVEYTDGQKIVVASSMTLYAVWSSDASSYTVTFDGNGGTGYMPAQNFTSGVAKALEQNIFVNTGSTFQGWSLTSGGSVLYTNGQMVKDIASATGTVTLYAIWSPDASSYTVTFDGNGGTGYMPDQDFTSDVSKALAQNMFANNGNTFQGWALASGGSVLYTDGQKISVTADMTLYAVWSSDASSYTVTFDGNGGAGYMPAQNFTSGVAKALEQNIFVNNGNTFQGWSLTSGGSVLYTNGQMVKDIASATGTVTLYAVWSPDASSYTVTFDGNGGTGYMPAQNFTSGTAKALEQNVFTRSGYAFQGWSLASGGPVLYTDGQKISVTADTTLFAVWTLNASSYTVTFDGNGGTGYMPAQNFTSGVSKSLAQNLFANTGSTFQGWSSVVDGEVVYSDGQKIVVASDMTLYAVWTFDASSFTVTFNGNGGTGLMPDQYFTADTAKALAQNLFANTGSTFQGWALAPGGPVFYTDGQKIFVTADMALYAIWSPDASSYTVVFNSNGGTGYMPDQDFTSGVAKALQQNVFTRSGYTFQGWAVLAAGDVVFTDGQSVKDMAAAGYSVTLYAVWTSAASYAVTFDSNTGTGYMPAQNFTENTAKALQQNIFVKSGYTFQGWSTASDGTVEYTDGQKIVVASSMTLYAVWSSDASSYTVTFDGNGGTGYMPAQNFTSGVAKALEQNIFVNTGSTFQGWSLTSGGSVLYTNGQMVKDIASATGTVTLYAIWSPDASSYTVTFDGNGGTGYMPDQDFTSDVSKALAQNMFANNGNTFQGWALASGGSVLYTDGQKISVTADMTLYAVWSSDASSYTVTFDGNGGAGYMPAQNFTSGVAKALEQNIFVNNGNTFQGWSLTSGGSVLYTNGQMVKDIASATGTVTLYAVWSPDASSYTVTFDGNGGTGYMPAQNFTSGTAKALEQNVFTRSGYAFQGWSLASGGPVLYTDGQKISVTADTTLFAVWTLNASSYTVTFDGNGGTGYMPAQNFTSGVSKSLAQNLFANTGSTFQGWSYIPGGSVLYTDGQRIFVTADTTLYAIWSPDAASFTVTFNGNGGTGYMPDQSFTSGTVKALEQNVFTRSGYTFQGWSDIPGGYILYTDGQMVRDLAPATGTVTLYAIWSPDASSCIVVFNSNGGTGYMPAQNFTSGVAKALQQNVFTRSGYTFQGWALASGGSVLYTDGQRIFVTADMTLYAIWSADVYTVTFNGNGGTGYMPTQNFEFGVDKTLTQNIFVKSGSTFQGWSLTSGGSVLYIDVQKVSIVSSMTLYAVWSSDASSYTVTFNGNGGTGYMPDQHFTSGTAKALAQNIFTRSGYAFQGWSLASGGSVLYTNGQMVKDIASATGTVTLYAIWSPDASSYTVTFDGNGGTGYMPDQDFTSGTAKALEQNVFTRSGYAFQGWSLASGGSVLYTDGQKILVASDMTLYAVWSVGAFSYTVTFDGNGGTGYMPDQHFTSGTAKALAQNIFVNTGNTFQGWAASPGGSVVYNDCQRIFVTADTTLYAIWSSDASSFTVTFDGNGGTGLMFDQYFTSGVSKALAQNLFAKSGNTFQGWSTSPGGSVVVYTDGQRIFVTADMTLYAVWTPDSSSYTVTFNGNGGTGYMPAQYFTIGTAKALEHNAFTRDGYAFQGWAIAPTGDVIYTDGQKIVVTSDMTLYAVWSASSYVVTFERNGGTGYMPAQNFTADIEKALQQNLFAKAGSTFQGWSTSPAGSIVYTNGQKIVVSSSMTLYAVWSADSSSYTVTFDGNGGAGYMPAQNFTSGVAKALQQNIFAKSGYAFQGWAITLGGAVEYGDGETVTDIASAGSTIVLYAVWGSNTAHYDATFVGNYSGSAYSVTISEVIGSTYVLPADDPVRSGYAFDGWYTAATGGSRITSSTTVGMTAATTFYAHWTLNPAAASYTVTFSSGTGYDVSYSGSATVESGGSLTFTVSVSSGYVLNSVTATGGIISHYSSGYMLSDITADSYVSISVSPQSTPETPTGTDGGDSVSSTIIAVAAVAIIASLVAALVIFFRKMGE